MKKHLFFLLLVFILFICFSCEEGNMFEITENGEDPPIPLDSVDTYVLVIENLIDTLHILRGTLANGFNVGWNYEQIVSGTEIELSLDSIFTHPIFIDSVEYLAYSPGDYYLEIISIKEQDPDSLYSIPTDAVVKIKNLTQETEYIINELTTTDEIFILGDTLVYVPRNFDGIDKNGNLLLEGKK